MKIHLVSDLHEEHWAQRAISAIDRIPENLGDVLVVAGDLLQASFFERGGQMEERFARLRQKANEVIYVMGNHEPYERDVMVIKRSLGEICQEAGIHFLDDKEVTIGKQRFVGSTLWYGSKEACKFLPYWSDGCVIGLSDRVRELHTNGVRFLSGQVQEGVVVVTHMLPSYQSVPPQFVGTPANCVFVTPMDDLIVKNRPKLWLHGHTHTSCDYKLNQTRVVCSPLGYPRESGSSDAGFMKRLSCVVEI